MTTSAAAQPRTLSTPDPVAGRIGGQVIVEARSGYCSGEHDTERPGTSPSGITVMVVEVAAVVVLDVLDGAVEVVDTTDTGVYTFTAPELTQSGLHTCRVDGTDPTGAAERSIGVRQSRFANP